MGLTLRLRSALAGTIMVKITLFRNGWKYIADGLAYVHEGRRLASQRYSCHPQGFGATTLILESSRSGSKHPQCESMTAVE